MKGPNQVLCFYLVFVTLYSVSLGDEWPVWKETLEERITAGILENTPLNRQIGTLEASDPEGGSITYSGGGDVFNVDPNSGSVTLKRILNAEVQKYIPVEFTAKDRADNLISAAYVVKVLDVNDNPPAFQYLPYTPSVYEGDVNQTLVFDGVVAKDVDSGENAEIEFSCVSSNSACDMFSITGSRFGEGLYRGLIHLKQDLPNQGISSYQMTIQAQDKGPDRKSTQTTININVNRFESSPPRLQNLPARFTVFESDQAGSIVGELAVSYPNGTSSAPVGVSIERDPGGYFTMDASGVEVRAEQGGEFRYYSRIKLAKQLDRETMGDSYFFDVRVYDLNDRSKYSISTVGVEIGDANDNPPTFDKENYQFYIPEGLQNGDRLTGVNLVVTDIDSSENSQYDVAITEADFYSFKLTPRSGKGTTSFTLDVDEARYLDYELPDNRVQTIVVTARNVDTVTPQSSSATVSILLHDRNDNSPKFVQSSYRASVREDRPPGFNVINITATDADSGNNGKVTYSFNGGSNHFNVDRNSGKVTLKTNLDFRSQPQLRATIRATDGAGKYTDVPFTVSVREYNEDGPEFEEHRYAARSERDSNILNPSVKVQASVVGEENTVIRYKIVEGNVNNAFIINEDTGLLSLVKTVTKKDTPDNSGYFTLIVEAYVAGSASKSNTVPVIISVRDSINNAPVFKETVIIKRMMENTPEGSLVATVEAIDNDEGENGIVTYRISDGDMGKFVIGRTIGDVRLAIGASLDIERSLTTDYNIEVIAVDQGTPPLTATATVIVNVQDFNNKPPSFGQRSYVGTVLETQDVGTLVLNVQASDPDSSAQILYQTVENSYVAKRSDGSRFYDTSQFDFRSAFLLNSQTGSITTARRLDYKLVSEVSFDVTATDTNGQNQQDRASVVIYIQSSDIDYLIFDPPSQTVDFNEEEPIGSVVTGLVAKDPRTQNPADSYQKVAGSDRENYFYVNTTNGEINLVKRLDYETLQDKQISVQIQASMSSGSGLQTAIGTVIINVKDINDQFPIFNKNGYTFEVPEGTVYGTVIGQVRTTDRDTEQYYKDRKFSLAGPDSDKFHVNEDSGDVSVLSVGSLDRETQEVYSLLVTAADNPNKLGNGERRATTVQLNIRLLDKNDNAPIFPRPMYTIVTSETVSAGIILLNAQATDLDAGLNSKLTYAFNPPDLWFDVDNLGNIQTKRDLGGRYREAPYILTLEATDSAVNVAERLTGRTLVNITVEKGQAGDQGRPVITKPDKDYVEIFIAEEGQSSKYVTTVEATDPEGEELTYRLLDNPGLDHKLYFEIRNTNQIWTIKTLDREVQEKYEIVVEVIDNNPNPKGAIRTMYIKLTDIDDNKPGFESCSDAIKRENGGVVPLPETVPKDIKVTRVQACDSDAPPHNKIYYYITCGNTENSFRIDKNDGTIYTARQLTRTERSQYRLCIYVSDKPNLSDNEGKFNPDTPPGQGTVVNIYLDGSLVPKIPIPKAGYISGFVLTGDTYGTEVSRIQATNSHPNIIYRIVRQTFNGEDIDAFRIDKDTGIIRTKQDNFYSYEGGYFVVIVEADNGGRKTEVPVRMYVVDPSGRVRFRFDRTPEQVYKNYQEMLDKVEKATGIMLVGTSLTYHVRMDGLQDDQKSDICFYVIKDSSALNREDALRLLDSSNNAELAGVYAQYRVTDIESCDRKLSSRWWGGWWWPWWVIIASACFIIVSAIILIIILFLFKDWRGPGLEWQSRTHHIQD